MALILLMESVEILEILRSMIDGKNVLHKLLAHSEEMIRECNSGYGLKSFWEEGVVSCNKLG